MQKYFLCQLKPDDRFEVVETGVTGVLVKANDCRARVRIDRPPKDVEFIEADGGTRHFQARRSKEQDWTPYVEVFYRGSETQTTKEQAMSTKTTKKTKTPKATKATTSKAGKAKAPKAARAPRADAKLSCLDAAAKVLGETKEAMTTAALIEQMAAKKYWTSPGGKTPAATLYSAIITEIARKGNESRFKKVDRGQFALA